MPLSAHTPQAPVPTPEADNASHAPAQAGEASEYAPTAEEMQAAADRMQAALRAPDPPLDPARIEAMRRRALSLLDDADAFDADGDEPRASDVRGEAEALMAQVDAACDPSQDTLGF